VGDLCRLRRWLPSDHDALLLHADNPNIACFLRDLFPHPYTSEAATAWLSDPVHAAEPPTEFAIDVSGEAVGGIGLIVGRDVERFSAEVGYWLGEGVWGRGIGTAALCAVTEHGFGTLGLHRIFALPFSHNTASIRLLERAGYRFEARLAQSAFKNGVFVDQDMWVAIHPLTKQM
jgi:RimJ/RimL family protein N-acetyltransferase